MRSRRTFRQARALLEYIDPLAATEQLHLLGLDDEHLTAFVRHAHAVHSGLVGMYEALGVPLREFDLQRARERPRSDRKGRPQVPRPGGSARGPADGLPGGRDAPPPATAE